MPARGGTKTYRAPAGRATPAFASRYHGRRRMTYREDEIEEGDDDAPAARDEPDEFDRDHDDDPATVACPYCRKEIFEEAELCPHCGSYISFEDAPRRHPRWLVAGVLVCITIVLIWVVTHA